MMEPALDVRETAAGLSVRVHVQPRAKRTGISGSHNGALKVKLAAPPVDDAANRALIDFFSSLFHLPKSRITILAGLKSKDKVLLIKDLSLRDFRSHLASAGA
jgi:uncharacterized protein (TIGR00251 family)